MKNIYVYLISIFLLAGCQVLDKKEMIPSYLRINKASVITTSFEGSNSHNITDIWAYIDDTPIGAFEIPAKFPTLYSGEHRILLKAGIKLNGIAATRSIYPFYDSYVINTELSAAGVLEINPQFKYSPNLKFEFVEAFEDAGIVFDESSSSTGHMAIVPATEMLNEMQFATVELDEAHNYFECATLNSYDLPKDGSPIFVELNYKCTSEIVIGLFINYAGGSVTQEDVLHINPSEKWNKIYVNLTNYVKAETTAKSFKIYFSALKPAEIATSTICFDNIKLIH